MTTSGRRPPAGSPNLSPSGRRRPTTHGGSSARKALVRANSALPRIERGQQSKQQNKTPGKARRTRKQSTEDMFIDFEAPHMLLARKRLKTNTRVLEVLEAWWVATDADGSGAIGKPSRAPNPGLGIPTHALCLIGLRSSHSCERPARVRRAAQGHVSRDGLRP